MLNPMMLRSPVSALVLTSSLTSLLWMLAGCAEKPLLLRSLDDSLSVLPALVIAPSPEERAQASKLREQGLADRNQGRMDDAIATLDQAVQLDPEELSGYVILGWTQHLAGQRDAATDTLLRALERDPDHIPALNALGIVYLVNGELDKAVETHTQALQLNPANEIAAYNLSLAYQRLHNTEQAIAHARQATQLEPENPHPWVALAIAHFSQGDQVAAQQAYQEALRLDGRYGDRGFLSHLEQAGFSPGQIQLAQNLLSQTP